MLWRGGVRGTLVEAKTPICLEEAQFPFTRVCTRECSAGGTAMRNSIS
jgi:hypothetical protein